MHHKKQSFEIYDSNSHPFGIPYVKWTTIWWKWLLSIPRESNPAFDTTGEFCGMSQNNLNVWFLAGTFGGSAMRKCTIPYGKAILFPVINYESTFADQPSLRTEKQLEEQCSFEIDQISDMYASLDGEPIDLLQYRVRSCCIDVDLPSDNCLGTVKCITKLASDGYWVFLAPLSIGNHLLRSFGSCMSGKIKIGCSFQLVIE